MSFLEPLSQLLIQPVHSILLKGYFELSFLGEDNHETVNKVCGLISSSKNYLTQNVYTHT